MTSLTSLDIEALYEPPAPRPWRRFLGLLALFLAFVVVLAPALARAQDVPLPDAAPVLVPGVPSIDDAPLQFAALLVQLGQQGKWGPLVALAVFALVFLARKFASKLPAGKVRDALLSKWGGWGLNLAVALSAGVAGLLLSPVAVSVVSVIGVVGAALTYSLAAAGLVELRKDAAGKGDAAAAAVDTKAEALSSLDKGPQP